MKPVLPFLRWIAPPAAAVLLISAAVFPAEGASGSPLPAAHGSAPCDSVTSEPWAGEMLLFNVSVEGGGRTATISANDSFTVSFDYYIQVCDTPANHNFCQVVVGYASASTPSFCILRERVDCGGKIGTLTFRMKAPAFPSQYLIAFDLRRTLTEPPCPTTWPQGPPVRDRYLACIDVTAGNVPVPLTGPVSNVTSGSATLHATVHPGGAPTTVRFLYGTNSAALTDSVVTVQSPVSGSTTFDVSAPVSGLAAHTRYYYRATAENQNGYNVGAVATFFTGPLFVLATPEHSFGHQQAGAVLTDSVTVVNAGNVTLQISSVIPLIGQYTASPLAASVAAGATRKFAVTFAPPDYGRYHSGIVFVHNGATSPDTLLVRGAVPIGGVLGGWNIVSVPLTVPDPRKTVVFPEAVSNAFEFSAGYVSRDTVVNGRGYWLKFPVTDSLAVDGELRNSETVPVTAGWNMVGGPSHPVPLDSIAVNPPGILAGSFFEYAGGYAAVSELRAGKGYWVKVSQPGTITLKGRMPAGAVEAAGLGRGGAPDDAPREGLITVTDAAGSVQHLLAAGAGGAGSGEAGEMPPPPPAGSFDVRFAGDRISAGLAPESGARRALEISGARHPVRIAWSAVGGGFVLDAGGERHPLDRPGSLTLDRETPVALEAAGAGERTMAGVAARSRLAANYPNPFNPSTVIVYELARPGRVRLAVYNALGEEVAVPVDAELPAGEHRASFDGEGLPGGVYFCRLAAGGESSMLKLVLMK